jgi:FeS assembly SUF system regulator
MFRLSKLTDYGTVILSYMATAPERTCSAADAAEAVGISAATASKVLKLLARHALLQSTRGSRGGYLLARSPENISVAEVVEAMEGPIGITECSAASGLCVREGGCRVRDNWQQLNQVIRQTLGGVSLADMVRSDMEPVVKRIRPRWLGAAAAGPPR